MIIYQEQNKIDLWLEKYSLLCINILNLKYENNFKCFVRHAINVRQQNNKTMCHVSNEYLKIIMSRESLCQIQSHVTRNGVIEKDAAK